MTTTDLTYKTYFGGFEVEQIASEPTVNYGLFQEEIRDTQAEQLKTFSDLESGLKMLNASSFGSCRR